MVYSVIGMKYNLSDLSIYRTQIMGWAAIFVIACHAVQYGVSFPPILRRILGFGNLGVDIFLLLSGLGCYYSLSNSYPVSSKRWITKRIIRVIIPYFIIHVFLLLGEIPLGLWNIVDWLFYLSTIKFWICHIGDWFVALIIPVYILTPLLWKFVEFGKYRIIKFLSLLVFFLLISHINFACDDNVVSNIIDNIQFALKRLPAFFIGLFVAPYVKRGDSVNWVYLFGILAVLCVITHFLFPSLFLWGYYVLPLTILVSYIAKIFNGIRCINSFFVWLGHSSLESYISNVGVKSLMPFFSSLIMNELVLLKSYSIQYVMVILIGLILTYAGHKLSESIKTKFYSKS